MPTEQDERLMRRAIELALKAKGLTAPNPLVGAVVLNAEGKIVGEGFHAKAGTEHAETLALQIAGSKAAGGTIYVNLEPCSHFGRTPPCAKNIVAHKIKKVVIGSLDPNPKVNGRGLEILRQAGLEVVTGVLEEECIHLNRFFFHWIKTGLPWLSLKVAASLNGKIANPKERWVTGQGARLAVHEMRAEYDAVLTGSGTVLSDDPALTVRLCHGRNPLRIILDRRLRCKPEHKLFAQAGQTWLYTMKPKLAQSQGFNSTLVKAWDGTLKSLMQDLGKQNVLSVLVEAGTELNGALLESGLVNEVLYFLNPSFYGNPALPSAFKHAEILNFKLNKVQKIDNDLLLYLDPQPD